MNKRKVPRYKRRIQLQFWTVDDKIPRKGFTQNISVNGMFVSSNAPFRPGNRVFLEIPSGQEKLVLQAEVRYSARMDPALQRVKPSGMGVRLLRVDEVMSELLKLKAAGVEVDAEPKAAAVEATAEETPSADAVFPVAFETPNELARTYERDIKYGGLFLAAEEPAEQDETVVIEFRFGWDSQLVVRVQALVVKRFASAEGSVAGESVAGMGVAFSDPADVIAQFGRVSAAMEQGGGQEGAGS